MEFYDRVGVAALGSRLRRLGDWLAEDATRIYALYGTDLQPRWFPVFYLLSEKRETSVTEIAGEIGHTHASVSQIVRDMVKAGYAVLKKRKSDGRKTFVSLSAAGLTAVPKIKVQSADVLAAVERLLGESDRNLWEALADCEKALVREDLFERVQRERKQRETRSIHIVPYSKQYAKAFKKLNEEWIRAHFTIEAADRKALNHPETSIINQGGHILVALHDDVPVGVCALLPHGEGCFELAKMAVSPAAQGKGVGKLLGQAAIQKSKECGAKRMFLESNTVLEAAISLYRKLGFKEIYGEASPYRRCNIQMELRLGKGPGRK